MGESFRVLKYLSFPRCKLTSLPLWLLGCLISASSERTHPLLGLMVFAVIFGALALLLAHLFPSSLQLVSVIHVCSGSKLRGNPQI